MLRLAILAILLLLSSLSAQAQIQKSEEDLHRVVRAGNAFALELYRTAIDDATVNAFLSPFSIHAALTVAYAGADGQTASEMAHVLQTDLPSERLHTAYETLYSLLASGEESELAIANALWVARGFELRPEYTEALRTHHGAKAREVDMRSDAADIINTWTSDQTRGCIEEIVSRQAIADAALVLTNAIYFLGSWERAFDPEQTRDEPFTRADGTTDDVPLMHQRGSFRYAELPGLQVIDLPYRDDSLTMTVLLPAEHDGLAALVSDLDT